MNVEKRKHIYLKFIITLIGCGVAGGILGALVSSSRLSIPKLVENLQTVIIMNIFPIAISGIVLLTLIIACLYLSAKSTYTNLEKGGCETEDDVLYEKIERTSDFGLIFSNILLIFAFVFFGTSLNYLALEKSVVVGVLPIILLFLVTVIISTTGSVLFVNLEKKINPEKRGNLFDGSFHKDWLNTSDEAEKFILYKASYQAFRVMQMAYLFVMMILLFAAIATPIGTFPFIIIGILWGLHTTLCCAFSMKLGKNSKLNPED